MDGLGIDGQFGVRAGGAPATGEEHRVVEHGIERAGVNNAGGMPVRSAYKRRDRRIATGFAVEPGRKWR